VRGPSSSLLGIVGLLFLTGCAIGPDWNALNQQAAQIRAACDSQHAAGTIKTALATEQCANPQIHNLYAGAHFTDLDVIDAYLAKREAVAAQEDRKAIGPEDARAQLAQALVDQNSTLQQRLANRATTYAAAYSTLPTVCNHIGPGTLICD
jgi:hypothetical protein